MSVLVSSAVWAIHLPDSEKVVLLALADYANDEGFCWPSIATLATKCSKSDRTVQGAIKNLIEKGHLTRNEVPGKGCTYNVHPRNGCIPEAASHRSERREPPKRLRTNRKEPSVPKKASPSWGKRATRIPADFVPVMTGTTKAAVDGWPPGRLEDEVEHFRDHHTAKGTLSHDWQASWRTWVKNAKKWEFRHGQNADRQSGWLAA